MMWSIWLWGFQLGQVRPMTARCQPGMKRCTSGPQVFMSPANTASGRASVRSCRRNSAQLRCEPMCRCDMWVPATEIGWPSTDDIDHQRRPPDAVGAEGGHRHQARRLDRELRPHQHGDAPRSLLGLLPARHGLHARRHRPHAVHVEGLVPVRPQIAGAPGGGCVGLGADAPPLAERVRLDLVPQKPGRLGRLTTALVARRRPGLLQHNDIGVERSDGSEIVVGPAPPVHPAVHVVVGDAQHGPTRR